MAATRRKRRLSRYHREAIQTVHDRRSVDLPINARVAPITVDDPHGIEAGEKIVVLRSLRDDPLAALHARGTIDQAQFAACRHWQAAYERVEIAGARAIDPTRDAVDGGQIPEPITDAMRRAARSLARAGRALGQEGESIIRDVLGRKMPLIHAAAARGLTSERDILYIGRRFKECAETLALVYGYRTGTLPLDKVSDSGYANRHNT